MHRSSTAVIVASLAALVAVAPTAAADEGSLRASEFSFNDPASQLGKLAMAMVIEAPRLDDAQGGAGAIPRLEAHAAALEARSYQSASFGTAAGPNQVDPPAKETLPLTDARLDLASFQPGFQLHVYSLEGPLSYRTETDGATLASLAPVSMGPGWLGKGSGPGDGVPAGSNPDSADFARVDHPGPLVVQDQSAPRFRLLVEGTMVLELHGLTLDATAADGSATLASGTWREPVDPALPPATTAAAYQERSTFLRLFLKDGSLEFATDGGSPRIALAALDVQGDHSGPVTLEEASGSVERDGRKLVLDGSRHVVAAGSRLQVAPESSALAIDVDEAPLGPSGGTLASVAAPASAALMGTGAVLALAIAVGIGLLRRVLRMPALADVETAIEEGDYRKAARLASRILARLPGSEEAALGRAIALSKSGRHQEVVSELTGHLARRPASDGTLHYVLGLAQLESGRETEGMASLHEAVRLTPALQAEVAPRLGKAFSVHASTTRDVHGYA